MVVRVLTLRTAGTNCDHEGIAAFQAAGASVDHRHVQEIYANPKSLHDYRIVFFPGGFSYGDDVGAGKIQAVETRLFLFEELSRFVDRGGLVLGVCNGFQTLVKTGLLPGIHRGAQEASLSYNDSGRFEDRWVKIKVEKSKAEFLPVGTILDVPIAHGEGKFIPKDDSVRKVLNQEGFITFRYVDEAGRPSTQFPENPNGSVDSIAGICDVTGRILGLMPHPERNALKQQHPRWTRADSQGAGNGLLIFQSLVRAAS